MKMNIIKKNIGGHNLN